MTTTKETAMIGQDTIDSLAQSAGRKAERCPTCNAGRGMNCIGIAGGTVHAERQYSVEAERTARASLSR